MYLGKYIIYNNSGSKIIYAKYVNKYYQTIAERLGYNHSVLEVLRDRLSGHRGCYISLISSSGLKSYSKIKLVQWAFMENEIQKRLIRRDLFLKNFQKEI